MKKAYTAPEIMFEDFTISTNIAAGCEAKSDLQAGGRCGFKWGKKIIFVDETTGCSVEVVSGDGNYDGLCYHNPSEDYNVFNS